MLILVERAGEKVGLSCLILLLFISFLSVAYTSILTLDYAMALKDELDGGEEKSLMLLVHVSTMSSNFLSPT
ncbi:hypothetical protein Bca4012_063011 [Brassica carinata]